MSNKTEVRFTYTDRNGNERTKSKVVDKSQASATGRSMRADITGNGGHVRSQTNRNR